MKALFSHMLLNFGMTALFLEGSQASTVCPTGNSNAHMKMTRKGETTYS
jgi:hypothetical protein